MPIKYTYLEDSSPFTADALNVRVSDATDGINELKQDDIGHGAFRTEHLPTMIGVPGIDDPADQLFAVSNHIKFNPTVHRSPYSSTFEIAGAVLNYTDTTGRPEVVPGGETTALLILFNLQVRRFLGKDLKAFHATANNYEDLVSATFWFKIKVINPNVGGTDPEISFGIPHSARTISPGLTQVEITDYDASVAVSYRYNLGQAYEWDDLSHKNVAIRTVLTGDYLFDLLGYAPDASGTPIVGTYYQIDRISVTGQCRYCKDGWDVLAIEYTKSNLTAIPIKAKVNTNE